MNTTASSTAAGTGNLQLEYVSSHGVASQPASWWQSVLGVVGFEKPPGIARTRIPVTASMTRSLNANERCEVWRVLGPDIHLSSGDTAQTRVQYRYFEDLLFGSLTIAEQAIDARSEAGALLRATEIAYQEIFDVLNQNGHRHLIRIWNYLPDINAQAGDDERYRHFNSARQMAFRKSGRATMGTVPAASALGSPAGSPISIYFLAARRPPKMIENPRQTSAYHYPPKFGEHSRPRDHSSRRCRGADSRNHDQYRRAIGRGESRGRRGAIFSGRLAAQSVRAQTVGSCGHRGHLVAAAQVRCRCRVSASRRVPRGFARGNRGRRLNRHESGAMACTKMPCWGTAADREPGADRLESPLSTDSMRL